MELEIIILSEVSQKEKDKYHMISLTCWIYNTNEHSYENKNKLTDIENRLVVAKGERGGEERNGRLGLADVNCYI